MACLIKASHLTFKKGVVKMIGVIDNSQIFEFRDEQQLITALLHYAEGNSSNTIIIANNADLVVAVGYDNRFVFSNLNDDIMYSLYGSVNNHRNLGRGDRLPNDKWQFENVKFYFKAQPLPQPISY